MRPPSTATVAPFTYPAPSEARNDTTAATSAVLPTRPPGTVLPNCSSASPMPRVPGVRIGPGTTALPSRHLGQIRAAHDCVNSCKPFWMTRTTRHHHSGVRCHRRDIHDAPLRTAIAGPSVRSENRGHARTCKHGIEGLHGCIGCRPNEDPGTVNQESMPPKSSTA